MQCSPLSPPGLLPKLRPAIAARHSGAAASRTPARARARARAGRRSGPAPRTSSATGGSLATASGARASARRTARSGASYRRPAAPLVAPQRQCDCSIDPFLSPSSSAPLRPLVFVFRVCVRVRFILLLLRPPLFCVLPFLPRHPHLPLFPLLSVPLGLPLPLPLPLFFLLFLFFLSCLFLLVLLFLLFLFLADAVPVDRARTSNIGCVAKLRARTMCPNTQMLRALSGPNAVDRTWGQPWTSPIIDIL